MLGRGRISLVLTLVLAGQALAAGDNRLHTLFDEAWERQLREDPLFASAVGRHDYDDRLPSVALADQARRAAYWRGVLDRLGSIEPSGLTADEVHRIGLDEVERIRSEMLEIVRQVGFEGDLEAFHEFLRTDPRFYAETAEQLLKEAAYIAKRMDGKLPVLEDQVRAYIKRRLKAGG